MNCNDHKMMETIGLERKSAIHWVAEFMHETVKCSKLPEGSEGESQRHAQHSHLYFLIVKTALTVFFLTNFEDEEGIILQTCQSYLFFFLVYSMSTFILMEIHIHSICNISCSSYVLLDSHIAMSDGLRQR